jgi:hypothetical protein
MRHTLARFGGLVLFSLALAATACDDQANRAASTTTASTTVAAKAAKTATAAPLPKPEPLDVALLKKRLRCAANSTGGPCRVINDFESCEPNKMVTPGGEGLWIGRGYQVKGSDFVEEYVLLRSRRVPMTEVGNGQIGAKIALAKLPEDETAAYRQARKAVNKLGRDDTPKSNNAAIAYLKRKKDWSESYAMEADKNQVHVVSGAGIYLCQRHEHQRLLLVERSSSGSSAADGLYAELFPATW